MEVNKIYLGDARDILGQLPDDSIQTCITSPPYWGLRDYGLEPVIWDGDKDCRHEWGNEYIKSMSDGVATGVVGSHQDNRTHFSNSSQFCQLCGAWRGTLGLEPTPDLYIRHLIQIFDEVKRVLRPDGTVFLNIGDSYIGGKGQSGTRGSENQNRRHQNGESLNTAYQTMGGAKQTRPADDIRTLRQYNLKPKDLCLIPFRFAIALQEAGWWVRSDIIWAKPNPMPESVTDRPTKSHEYIFLLAKSGEMQFWTHRDHEGSRTQPTPDYRWWDNKEQRELNIEPDNWQTELYNNAKRYRRYNLWQGHDYYYDADAIREPISQSSIDRWRDNVHKRHGNPDNWHKQEFCKGETGCGSNPLGRNKRTVWNISTKSYSGAHFATFPPAIPEICIKAGSSEKACLHCGAGWVRVVEKGFTAHTGNTETEYKKGMAGNRLALLRQAAREQGSEYQNTSKTTGWQPSCQCQNNDGSGKAIVLDPFAGSGTTCAVAKSLGRAYIGIDANPEYIKLAEKRIEMIVMEQKAFNFETAAGV